MLYCLDGDSDRAPKPIEPEEFLPHLHYFGVFSPDEIDEFRSRYHTEKKIFPNASPNHTAHFESFEGYDYFCLNVLHSEKKALGATQVCIYLEKNLLLFILQNGSLKKSILDEIESADGKMLTFARLICGLFDRMGAGAPECLEGIENEIAALENALITSRKRDCVREIIALRKKLMALKRYYEQLLNLLDNILENENGLFDNRALRYFKFFSGKTDRLYHSVLNLRDYVTQVREAYQAEVDISLNATMRFFTVVTSVFLPLTLIVGWYGMNLKMPEFYWDHAYAMVIGLSLSVVIFSIAYFKKNRWF